METRTHTESARKAIKRRKHMIRPSQRATLTRLVMSVLTLSIAACSSPKPMQRPTLETTPRATLRTDCTQIERDLTVVWAQRDYWCRPEHLLLPAAVKSPAASESLTLHPSSSMDIGCDALNPAAVDAALPPTPVKEKTSPTTSPEPIHKTTLDSSHQVAGLPPIYKALASVIPTCTAESDCASVPTPIESDSPVKDHGYTIPFAHTVQVLGAQGRAKIDALLGEVKQARQIELRGATLEDGLETWKNEFAVGRALAVRKRLTEAGVDRHRIKILYRDPAEIARWVRVRVYD